MITDEWADFFAKNRLRVGVSLDGPKDIHDYNRIFCNGKGSFDAVLNGLSTLRKYFTRIGVISVVTKKSIGRSHDVMDFLVKNGFSRVNLSPFAETDDRGLIEGSLSADEYADFMIDVFNYWMKRDDPRIRIQNLENFFQKLIGGKPLFCHSSNACGSYLSVDSNGDVYLCGRFLGINTFKLGNILESPLSDIIQSSTYANVVEGADSEKDECRSCRWENICSCGCSYYRFMNGGSLKSPYYFCKSTKRILTHMAGVIKKIDPDALVV